MLSERSNSRPLICRICSPQKGNFNTKCRLCCASVSPVLSLTSTRRRGLAVFHRPEFAQLEESLHRGGRRGKGGGCSAYLMSTSQDEKRKKCSLRKRQSRCPALGVNLPGRPRGRLQAARLCFSHTLDLYCRLKDEHLQGRRTCSRWPLY